MSSLPSHQVYEVKLPVLQGQTEPYAVVLDSDQEAIIKLICQQGCVCFKEFLAIQLAQDLGFPTLQPVQLDISEVLLKTLSSNQWVYQQFERHLSLPAFGTYYLAAARNLMQQDLNKKDLWPELVRIFCFDLLIRNFDRTLSNPNLLFRSDSRSQSSQIVVIDHEMGFCYPDSPWLFTEDERLKMLQHLCFKPAKESLAQEYSQYAQRIQVFMSQVEDKINAAFWKKVQQETPSSWFKQDEFTEIQSAIAGIIKHKTIFIQNILEVLA